MSAEEFELEARPGLPEELPEGEELLWQGRPQTKALARQAFKVRWLAGYFAVFFAARAVTLSVDGLGSDGALQLLVMSLLFAGCLGVCYLLAWMQARATVYSITSHRVVMRVGAALPITWNLPFSRMASADLTTRGEHDGDIVLRLAPPNRVAWLHLWPHVRPGKRFTPCPTLRAVGEPKEVAEKLEKAVAAWAERNDAPVADNSEPEAVGTVVPLAS